jgi:hypothetical protein
MRYCYPPWNIRGDLPPLPECARLWLDQLLTQLLLIQLTLVIGSTRIVIASPPGRKQPLAAATRALAEFA